MKTRRKRRNSTPGKAHEGGAHMFSHPASLFHKSDFLGADSFLGFLRRFGKKRVASHPAAATRPGGTLVLVSQEDIYGRGQRRQPILLLRKGQEIPAHDLPKLI